MYFGGKNFSEIDPDFYHFPHEIKKLFVQRRDRMMTNNDYSKKKKKIYLK